MKNISLLVIVVVLTVAGCLVGKLHGEIYREFPEVSGSGTLLQCIDEMAESEKGIDWEVQHLRYDGKTYDLEMLTILALLPRALTGDAKYEEMRDRRLETTLKIAWQYPRPSFFPVLTRMANNSQLKETFRGQAVAAIARIPDQQNVLREYLRSPVDKIRAAALMGLCSQTEMTLDELKQLIQTLRDRTGDLTGTTTGIAASICTSFIEMKTAYARQTDVHGKLKVLLACSPFNLSPAYPYPYVRSDPLSQYVFAQMRDLVLSADDQTKEILKELASRDDASRFTITTLQSMFDKATQSKTKSEKRDYPADWGKFPDWDEQLKN
ncbi:MAG: hypothetical protein ACYC26_13305 [Phycisphaerales bacterium]